jgi:hypothetical protein
LGVGGESTDGEVEDYRLTINRPAPSPSVFVGQHDISTEEHIESIFAADVDGDGDLDVLSASRSIGLRWYENDGDAGFTAHTISTDGGRPYSVFAADVDGDGDIDVLSAQPWDGRIAWYENDGNQGFTSHTVSSNAYAAISVFAADVDGDGDIDILSASTFPLSGPEDAELGIRWYENDGSERFTAHSIDSNFGGGGYSVFAADMDGDGDIDVLGGSRSQGVVWYENDGSQRFGARTLGDEEGVHSVFAADVDGDGDIDVLSTSAFGNKIAWYENNGSALFDAHTISTAVDDASSVFAADVDGDGDIDVLSVNRTINANDTNVAWYENDGSQHFVAHSISSAVHGGSSVIAGDVDGDGDGDLDVLSASAFGVAGFASIAWYENRSLTNFDHGDAPAPYPTLDSAAGASHVAQGPTLGALRDVEFDGLPADDADGDGNDEDGITLSAIHIGELNASVIVNVQDALQGAKLDAWIDFDRDGSWDDPGEQIFASAIVSDGDNAMRFDVPTWAIEGSTYARFRLSTDGGLEADGRSADGEVEDYRITLDPFVPVSGVFIGPNTISTDANDARSVFAADVDGDGDMDVLSASRLDHKIAWYENDGGGHFMAHTISTDARGAMSVFAADVDGDGDMDVLSASSFDDKIAWYENDGDEGFTAHTIDTSANGAYSVFAVDLDGDGDIDVLSAALFDDKIAWYENDGSENFTAHTISTAANFATSVFAVDLDGDGDIDVLSASRSDDKIAWYENDGNAGFKAHTISTDADEARSVFAADLDGDGDIDVLSASSNETTAKSKIAWYENDGNQGFTARTISTPAHGARSVFAADVDGDGDIDVLSASTDVHRTNDNKIVWYENDGNKNFKAHTIGRSAFGAQSVFAADVDGDGNNDVLIASTNDNTIAWYENLSPAIPADLTGDGFVDFGDLTKLLANWGKIVSAAEGNLVEPGSTVDFADLTTLLAAWTGPEGAASPQAAVTESPLPSADEPQHVSESAPTRHTLPATHRQIARRTLSQRDPSPLRRLQATDRAMADYRADEAQRRDMISARRIRRGR